MANVHQRPTHKAGTRTYEGAVCGSNPTHGRTRYRANGGCVMCAKLASYDRYQDLRRFRQSPGFKRTKALAFSQHMDAAVRLLREAAVNLRAAKEHAERGAWSKNVRSHGLQPKALAAIRRWLEEKEQLERTAATTAGAKDPGKSWMD